MVWDRARVTPKPWQSVVEFFGHLADRNDDFRPLLHLVEHVASRAYAASVFAATSGTALLVAREAGGDWTVDALRVDVALNGSIRFTLPQRRLAKPTTFECDGRTIVAEFERTMLPEAAFIDKGTGNLDRIAITAAEGEAHVYLHGAHVTHFKPRGGRPVLFVSRRSHFEAGAPGKPIRGGVPLCFPWFGPKAGAPDAPMHGFARTLTWQLDTVTRNDRGAVRTTLHLESNDFTRRLFPHDFAATFVVTIDARLTMELRVRNTGREAILIEEALHSYFAVGDVRRVSIAGLEGLPYLDKADAGARKEGEKAPIAIARETDRVYAGARGAVSIADPVWGRRLVVGKSGSATTVVWNPWIDKAKAMPDFGDEEWSEMVCVETANAMGDAITIAPGATHAMSATIAVEPI